MTENEAEKTSGNETASGSQEQTTATPARAGNPAMLTAMVMVMVLVIAGTFYLTGKIRTVEESINSRIENIAGQSESVTKQIDALNNEIDQLRTQSDTLADSITGLYQQLPAGNEDWALSEIEYLLIIATHRIMLERDVDTALAAMEAAELRLRDLNNPDLIPVREQFVADINKLKAVNQVDVTGLSIYLADIIDRANSLPLKKVIPETGIDEAARDGAGDQEHGSPVWRNFLSSVWQELKSLVVIKRSGETRQALLLPDQEYFLYQNLRLELENARLSVLRRDTQNLHTSVNLLVSWLEDYFNSSDASVANVIETLQKMSTLELKPELPDINSSLETLRAYLRMNRTGDGEFPGTEILQP
jgi:uroporphyrin-3 C-methyltransferase